MSKPTPYMPKGQRKARNAAMRRRETWMGKMQSVFSRGVQRFHSRRTFRHFLTGKAATLGRAY